MKNKSDKEKNIKKIKSLVDSIHNENKVNIEVSEPVREHSEAYFELRRRALKYIGIDSGKSFGQVMRVLNDNFTDSQYTSDLKKEVIHQLIKDDYLDEELCGRRIIKRHAGRKQKSKQYLYYLMDNQGISKSVINALMEEIEPDEDTAENYFYTRLKEWDFDNPEKIIRHFSSRGFSPSITMKIMRKYADGKK